MPPSEPPTPPPTTTPPTPEPEPPRPEAAAVSIAVTATVVAPGEVVSVSGTVTDEDGAEVADRRVRLAYRTSGGEWTTYAAARSADDGSVAFTGPPVTENLATRLVVKRRVVSAPVRVEVKPEVGATADAGQVEVSTLGGQRGDTVVLVRRTRDGVEVVDRQRLDAEGRASFTVEQRERPTVYGVRLLRTPQHLAAEARVVVRPAD